MPEIQSKPRGRKPKTQTVHAIVFGGGPPYELESLWADKDKAEEELQRYDHRFNRVEIRLRDG